MGFTDGGRRVFVNINAWSRRKTSFKKKSNLLHCHQHCYSVEAKMLWLIVWFFLTKSELKFVNMESTVFNKVFDFDFIAALQLSSPSLLHSSLKLVRHPSNHSLNKETANRWLSQCLTSFIFDNLVCSAIEPAHLCCRGKENLQQGKAPHKHWNYWPCGPRQDDPDCSHHKR